MMCSYITAEIEIPEGKVVLLMDTSGVSEYYDFLSRLHAGQTLTVANQASEMTVLGKQLKTR